MSSSTGSGRASYPRRWHWLGSPARQVNTAATGTMPRVTAQTARFDEMRTFLESDPLQ